MSGLGICLREKEGCQRGGPESLALFVLVSSLFLHLAFVEVVMQYVSMIFVFPQMKWIMIMYFSLLLKICFAWTILSCGYVRSIFSLTS